jgi:hypothetical protein
MPYLPVSSTAALTGLVLGSERVSFELLRDTEAGCDYCPRPASHRLATDTVTLVLVCRSHARVAASALVGSLG